MDSSAFFVDREYGEDLFKVHINPDRMTALSLNNGQTVKITAQNRRSILVNVYAAKGDCQFSYIKMGLSVRTNLDVYLGQTVVLEAVSDLPPAEMVAVSPIAESIEDVEGGLLELLMQTNYDFSNFPVCKGMIIPLYALHHVIELKVTACVPAESVMITSKDCISYKNMPINRTDEPIFNRITYDSIGGLNAQIDELRKYIEIPLLQPRLFSSFGVKPSSGILITGESGSGKSYLVKAVQNETPVHCEYIKSIDLLTMSLQEAAFILRRFCDRVIEKAPSILILDDIDLIAGDQYITETAVDRHLAASIVATIDRISATPGCVFIATAKSQGADSIPAEFKRSGRLEAVIELPTVGPQGAVDVIRAAIASTAISSARTAEDLAGAVSPGMGAGDLALTAERALMYRAAELMSKVDPDGALAAEDLTGLVIGAKRFAASVPSASTSTSSVNSVKPPIDAQSFLEQNNSPNPLAAMFAKQKKQQEEKKEEDPFASPRSDKKPGDPFASPPRTEVGDDPFSHPSFAAHKNSSGGDPALQPSTVGADPFGPIKKSPRPSTDSDIFGSTPGADMDDPFGSPRPPKSSNAFSDDPFGSQQVNNVSAPHSNDPFAQPQSNDVFSNDPFGQSNKAPNDDPFGQPQPQKAPSDPFGGKSDPFSQPAQSQNSAANDPFGGKSDPFSQPQKATNDAFANDPFGQPSQPNKSADPFSQPKDSFANDPFSQPSQPKQSNDAFANDPFSQPSQPKQSNDPFGGKSDPFSQPAQPQNSAANDPFGGKSDPFSQPAQSQSNAFANDPFGQPSRTSQPAEKGNDPFSQAPSQADPFAQQSQQQPQPAAEEPRRPVSVPHKKVTVDPFAPKNRKR